MNTELLSSSAHVAPLPMLFALEFLELFLDALQLFLES